MKSVYIIPKENEIEESLRLSEKYHANFEYNDFFLPFILDDEEKKKELIEFYKSLPRDRSMDTLHGAFLDVTLHSADRKIKEISELRVRQSMEIAKELGIRGVIFHTNMIANFKDASYMQNWVQCNANFYKELLREYPGIDIFMENMFDFDPDMLLALAKEMKEEPHFGVCLDYAHATISKVSAQVWFESLKPYIKHIHINDNNLEQDQHKPIGQGKIDYKEFHKLMVENEMDVSVLVEVGQIEEQKISLEYMKEEKIYPLV
ncbi:MAG: sugar phosphate isomerase/epimerase [Lachnospiraceae bacterium]|nr:sugar phosphate isomerase/epimerase [Lachnospiraceae bacterium]